MSFYTRDGTNHTVNQMGKINLPTENGNTVPIVVTSESTGSRGVCQKLYTFDSEMANNNSGLSYFYKVDGGDTVNDKSRYSFSVVDINRMGMQFLVQQESKTLIIF